MAVDLAQLLADCEFAELLKDEEGNLNSRSSFDSGLTHLCQRHFSDNSSPSQNLESLCDTYKQK